MTFISWLEKNHPEQFDEFFGKRLGPDVYPVPPISPINTADFNPSYKDAEGRLYMPHHHYYDIARKLYLDSKRSRFRQTTGAI